MERGLPCRVGVRGSPLSLPPGPAGTQGLGWGPPPASAPRCVVRVKRAYVYREIKSIYANGSV